MVFLIFGNYCKEDEKIANFDGNGSHWDDSQVRDEAQESKEGLRLEELKLTLK